MTERPILFSAPMVRAILDGRKTQTRRVVKPSKDLGVGCLLAPREIAGEINRGNYLNSRYGQPGDRLWVREAYRTSFQYDHIKPRDLPVARTKSTLAVPFWYDADLYGDLTPLHPGLGPGKYRPGMFMPRAASRITLEITAVRVERLHDINGMDATHEGAPVPDHLPDDGARHEWARGWFRLLWNEINGDRSWHENPWVWVVEFRRVEAAA
ncbi:hypothetical protein [Chitiniphilus eburneus]|uniref:hypothetical protein n=1 Tax=Chitiniphilus eburneus TaxID=2571148 RepID=UPI0035CFC3AB